ncbi:hypothetical protein J5N97_009377 [Dioscorea zingiberensis]|uniref:CCHC-type domain-containing protein n=1 Tax=Dioscorea zingiberensis TaxID=325984 RepID=A0A9D5HML5_9LILI|nr:hypothetical protein J5N97_009377 [Dioscorea zingiberensis]
MLKTPAGNVEVCGQCLRQGHMAWECRRMMTCRVCGGVGHKGRDCRSKPRGTGRERHQHAHPQPAAGLELKESDGMRPQKNTTGQASKYAGSKEKSKVNVERRETHNISLALDEGMVNGKEAMRPFTIATVTKGQWYADSQKIAAALQVALDSGWQWATKPLRDGPYVVHCRGDAEAREMEHAGVIELPHFSLSFEPLTTDLWNPRRPKGEIRWLDIRQLPIFCWNRDTTARILKPIGDLVYVERKGGYYIDYTRAAVRIRQGRKIPYTILFDIGSIKHEKLVDLARGEPPLPWAGGGQPDKMKELTANEEGRWRDRIAEKGKQPAPEANTGPSERHKVAPVPAGAASTQNRSEGMKATQAGTASMQHRPDGNNQAPAGAATMQHRPEGKIRAHRWPQLCGKDLPEGKNTDVPGRSSKDRARSGRRKAVPRPLLLHQRDRIVVQRRQKPYKYDQDAFRLEIVSRPDPDPGTSDWLADEQYHAGADESISRGRGRNKEKGQPSSSSNHSYNPEANKRDRTKIINDKERVQSQGNSRGFDKNGEEWARLDTSLALVGRVEGRQKESTEEGDKRLKKKTTDAMQATREEKRSNTFEPVARARGRPRKNKTPPKEETEPSIKERGKRKMERDDIEGMDSSLFTVPLIFSNWDAREIAATSKLIGVDMDQSGNMQTYVQHMRQKEAENLLKASGSNYTPLG